MISILIYYLGENTALCLRKRVVPPWSTEMTLSNTAFATSAPVLLRGAACHSLHRTPLPCRRFVVPLTPARMQLGNVFKAMFGGNNTSSEPGKHAVLDSPIAVPDLAQPPLQTATFGLGWYVPIFQFFGPCSILVTKPWTMDLLTDPIVQFLHPLEKRAKLLGRGAQILAGTWGVLHECWLCSGNHGEPDVSGSVLWAHRARRGTLRTPPAHVPVYKTKYAGRP